MKYTEDELAQIIEHELSQALGASGSEISAARLRNLQYYKAEAIGELGPSEIPDRSSIVSSDVADTVEWMLPSLVRVFAASQDAIECEASKAELKPTAKIVSEYLKHVFWKRNNGFSVLVQWFKDALIQKVGFVKIYWEQEEKDEEESYTQLLPEQVAEVLKDGEAVAQSAYEVMTDIGSVVVYDITVKRKIKTGCVKVQCVPPEEMRIYKRARYGEEPLFVAHVHTQAEHDLKELGYNLSDVSPGASADNFASMETLERNSDQSLWFNDDTAGPLKRYEVQECYIKLDVDGDGVAEWRRIVKIGDKIFENEKTTGHPFAFFCPSPLPHTFFGNCPADFAINPQRLSTSLLRAIMDNVYLSVNQRTGVVDGEVNLDDLLNSRPNGVVRMKSANSLVPIAQNGLDQSAWNMVEWAQQWREQRTGYTRYSQGMSADALNPTATGISIITEKADQRIELISRVAGDSVRVMFEKMLDCMARYQNVPDQVELFNDFIKVDPREWKDGYHIRVNVGLGTGNKDKKAQVLQQVMQIQAPLIQNGVLDPNSVIIAAREFADAAGLTNAEQYFPDPVPPDPNKKSPDQIKQEMDMQKLQAQHANEAQKFQAEVAEKEKERQADAQKTQAQIDSQERIETARINADQQRVLLELAAGIMSSRVNAQASTNLINGSQLDQTAQSAGFSPQNVGQTVQEIQALSQVLQEPGALGNEPLQDQDDRPTEY